ncbi:MAG: non-canonical purine NTP pyrophosphatase, RdgB/HAM1 family [Opitutae bacterium]|mgnify:CR=1 FL=1|nr:non-canonical purine NTP pyrophosphatase, RdgB/HAM1 family [Opitutae bacterium]
MKIYLASGNQHKLSELRIALQQAGLDGCEVFSADLIGGMPEVDETGDTFEANAILKAEALRLQGPKKDFYLADDSGIEIDHLNGQPGIRSARYASYTCNDKANNEKVLCEMKEVPDDQRGCRFRCVLALVGEGLCKTFSGTCEGTLLQEYRGSGGFGYDPLFLPKESDCTFAEISSEEKAKISHRARALAKLKEYLRERLSLS